MFQIRVIHGEIIFLTAPKFAPKMLIRVLFEASTESTVIILEIFTLSN